MKNYLKLFNPVKYLFAIIILYVLYTYLIPKDNLPESIKNIYIFIAFGLVILIIHDLMIAPIFNSNKEYYNSESSEGFSEESSEGFSEESSEGFSEGSSEGFSEGSS